MAKRNRIDRHRAVVTLDDVSLRYGERVVFRHTRWTWRRGEQWAILGPNGAGKSLLASALDGTAIVCQGEIHYDFSNASPDRIEEGVNRLAAVMAPRLASELPCPNTRSV